MASQTYVNLQPPAVDAGWLNDVNGSTYGGNSGYVWAARGGVNLGQWQPPGTPIVVSTVTATTLTPTFTADLFTVTALASPLTLVNPFAGGPLLPQEGYGFVIRIKDNGVARALTYGTQYRPIGVALPSSTVAGKILYLGCIWNSAESTVDVLSVAQQV